LQTSQIDERHYWKEVVHHAVFQLPEELREIMLLHYVEKMDLAQIGDCLELETRCVERRLQKALQLTPLDLAPFLPECAPLFHASKARARIMAMIEMVETMADSSQCDLVQAADADCPFSPEPDRDIAERKLFKSLGYPFQVLSRWLT
jgi:hypothetical protein